MLVVAFDSNRLINFSLHTGDPLTDAETDQIVSYIEKMANALKANPSATATTVVLAETDTGPNAKQRKRIGEATKRLARHNEVLITSSAVVRAIMTAIRWFAAERADRKNATFSTYAEARAWLVRNGVHGTEIYDAMLAEVRARASSQARAERV